MRFTLQRSIAAAAGNVKPPRPDVATFPQVTYIIAGLKFAQFSRRASLLVCPVTTARRRNKYPATAQRERLSERPSANGSARRANGRAGGAAERAYELVLTT